MNKFIVLFAVGLFLSVNIVNASFLDDLYSFVAGIFNPTGRVAAGCGGYCYFYYNYQTGETRSGYCSSTQICSNSYDAQGNLIGSCQGSIDCATTTPAPTPTPVATPAPTPIPVDVCTGPGTQYGAGYSCSYTAGYCSGSWCCDEGGYWKLCTNACSGGVCTASAPTPTPTPAPQCTYETGGCNDVNKWCYNNQCTSCTAGYYNCNSIQGCESSTPCGVTATPTPTPIPVDVCTGPGTQYGAGYSCSYTAGYCSGNWCCDEGGYWKLCDNTCSGGTCTSAMPTPTATLTPTATPTPTPSSVTPSCWTCDSSSYSSWIGDSYCDSGCGENSNLFSQCYSAACASTPATTPTPAATPTPTPVATPVVQPSIPSCWTCSANAYNIWARDDTCDTQCGETSDKASNCYSAACAPKAMPTLTPVSTPVQTPKTTPTPAPISTPKPDACTGPGTTYGSGYECSYTAGYCSGNWCCDEGGYWKLCDNTCSAGGCTAPKTLIGQDKEPPSLLVSTTPSGTAVILTATASDNVAVSSVRIYADETASGMYTLEKECSSSSCSATFGPYQSKTIVGYYAIAYDTANNQKSSATESFTVNPQQQLKCGVKCGTTTCKPYEACTDTEISDEFKAEKSSCKLSADCATCSDVVAKYPATYKIKEKPCSNYGNCLGADKDDFGQSYSCVGYLCGGECAERTAAGTLSADKESYERYDEGEEIKLTVTATNAKKLEALIGNKWESFACINADSCSNTWTLKAVAGEHTYQARITDLNNKIIDINPVSVAVSEKQACPFTCMVESDCALKGGSYKLKYSCPLITSVKDTKIKGTCCLLPSGEPNKFTLELINIIQVELKKELEPLETYKIEIDLPEGISAITGSDLPSWKKALGILGVAALPVMNFLNDLSLLYLAEKEARISDLTQQVDVYDLVEAEVERGMSVDEILDAYKKFVAVVDNKGKTLALLSTDGSRYLKNKYDSILSAYKKKCKEVRKNLEGATAADRDFCRFPLNMERDLIQVSNDELRLIKEIGNPEPLLLALAKFDRATRTGSGGFAEALDVYYQLAKRLDEKQEYGAAAESYDTVYTGTIGPELKSVIESYKELVSGGQLNEKGQQYINTKYDKILPEGVELGRELCGKKALAQFCSGPGNAINALENLKNAEINTIFYMANYDKFNEKQKFRRDFEEFPATAKSISDAVPKYANLLNIYDYRKFVTAMPPASSASYDNLASAINVNFNSNPLHRFSDERLVKLSSSGHRAKRILFYIGAGLTDPTAPILPLCLVPCKLALTAVLKPAVIAAKITKLGVEGTIQLLMETYRISREAAEAVAGIVPKMLKEEAGSVDFSSLFGKATSKTRQELTPFQRDVTEYLLPSRGVSFNEFLERFPQYKTYGLEQFKKDLPPYVKLYEIQGVVLRVEIHPSVYYSFIYRGEGKDIVELFDISVKQGGIKSVGDTFFTPDPIAARNFVMKGETGGLWVVRRDAIKEMPKESFSAWEGYEIFTREKAPSIPFEYTDKLLVSKESRDRILAKYGADNTELFGRPLKDVVVAGLDKSDKNLPLRIILDLSLELPPRQISPRLEVLLVSEHLKVPIDISVLERSKRIIKSQESDPGSPSELSMLAVDFLNSGASDSAVIDVIDNGMSASKASLKEVFQAVKAEKNIYGGENNIFLTFDLLDMASEYSDIGRVVSDTMDILKAKVSREDIAHLFRNSNSFDDFVRLGSLSNEEFAALLPKIKVTIPEDKILRYTELASRRAFPEKGALTGAEKAELEALEGQYPGIEKYLIAGRAEAIPSMEDLLIASKNVIKGDVEKADDIFLSRFGKTYGEYLTSNPGELKKIIMKRMEDSGLAGNVYEASSGTLGKLLASRFYPGLDENGMIKLDVVMIFNTKQTASTQKIFNLINHEISHLHDVKSALDGKTLESLGAKSLDDMKISELQNKVATDILEMEGRPWPLLHNVRNRIEDVYSGVKEVGELKELGEVKESGEVKSRLVAFALSPESYKGELDEMFLVFEKNGLGDIKLVEDYLAYITKGMDISNTRYAKYRSKKIIHDFVTDLVIHGQGTLPDVVQLNRYSTLSPYGKLGLYLTNDYGKALSFMKDIEGLLSDKEAQEVLDGVYLGKHWETKTPKKDLEALIEVVKLFRYAKNINNQNYNNYRRAVTLLQKYPSYMRSMPKQLESSRLIERLITDIRRSFTAEGNLQLVWVDPPESLKWYVFQYDTRYKNELAEAEIAFIKKLSAYKYAGKTEQESMVNAIKSTYTNMKTPDFSDKYVVKEFGDRALQGKDKAGELKDQLIIELRGDGVYVNNVKYGGERIHFGSEIKTDPAKELLEMVRVYSTPFTERGLKSEKYPESGETYEKLIWGFRDKLRPEAATHLHYTALTRPVDGVGTHYIVAENLDTGETEIFAMVVKGKELITDPDFEQYLGVEEYAIFRKGKDGSFYMITEREIPISVGITGDYARIALLAFGIK